MTRIGGSEPESGQHFGQGALLRCSVSEDAEATTSAAVASDGWREFVECGGQPEHRCGVDGELVVVAAEVLNERVASDHHARSLVGLESAHGPEPCLQPAMVAFDA